MTRIRNGCLFNQKICATQKYLFKIKITRQFFRIYKTKPNSLKKRKIAKKISTICMNNLIF